MGMQTNIEIPNPMSGAAYQVLFEKFQPANCQTNERFQEICKEMEVVLKWAETQTKDVKDAYIHSARFMMNQLMATIQRVELSKNVAIAYAAIPRPE